MRKMSLLLAVLLLTILALPAWGAPKSPALFREAPGKAKVPDDDPAVVRSRLVTVAFKSLALPRPRKPTGRPGSASPASGRHPARVRARAVFRRSDLPGAPQNG